MKNQMTLPQYRNLDLTVFALLYAVFEFVIIRVGTGSMFQDQAFTVSLAAAITTLVYMRWGAWGGVQAVLCGALYCLYSGGTFRQYIIYIVGNLFSLPAALALRRIGPERVRTGFWLRLLFPVAVSVLMHAGRALISLLLGAKPGVALGFFTTDSLSTLFTAVVIWITGRLDGVYEDQKHYLLRIQKNESTR